MERFWMHVLVGAPDECWPWRAGKNDGGYGRFERRYAHRVAYELVHGPIEPSMMVLHSCDNPSCCNPRHLSQGTNLQNMRQKVERARQARGASNGRAKLREADVLEIRAARARGASTHQLARDYGIAQSVISDICTRRKWRHI